MNIKYCIFILGVVCIHQLSFYIGKLFNIKDLPSSNRKLHKEPIVCSGGMAIFLSFFLMIYLLNLPLVINNIFIFGCYISILGLIDDKFSIDPFIRIFMQVAIISYFLYQTNLYLEGLVINDNIKISFGALKELITVIAIVFVINSFNYIDGIDGLCSIIFISLIISFMILLNEKYFLLYTLTPVLIFLIYNFNFFKFPKLYLGDNGSTLLGFLIASFSIYFSKNYSGQHQIADTMIIWILAFISFEFISTSLSRVLRKKSIFTPGNDHIHYILLNKYNSKYKVVIILFFLNILFILFGHYINQYFSNYAFIFFILTFFLYFYLRERMLKNKVIKK